MLKTTILIVFLLICTSSIIHAGDGNDLIQNCKLAVAIEDRNSDSLSDTDWMKATHCLGLIDGVSGLNALYQGLKYRTTFCLPQNGLQSIQGARIVVKYLEEHPELLHKSDVELTALALQKAYPCK